MNANEFADELEKAPTLWFKDDIAGKWIIEKLRQQQAEIEALKKEAALQRLSDFTQEAESFDRTASHMAGEYVSYPVKELTDEEIWEVINRTAWVGTEEEIRFKIAEAILRKAQEKYV